jgi:hypothetical protein
MIGMQKIKILTVVAIVITILTSVYGYSDAFASHGTDTASCENDGLYDGKNNPFSQELYEMCGDTYSDAYIEGCKSVEGNSEEICESATD